MKNIQRWETTIENEVHTVEYQPRTLFAKAKITIDGTTFPLVGAKLFSAHEEAFRLGDCRAIIAIDKSGKATVTVDGELLNEA